MFFLRNPWTHHEDIILMQQYLKKQSKWTEISKKLKGRNIYAIKNRIQCLCHKFQIPKNQKAMEETFRKVLNEIDVCNKKIHCEKNMDNQMIAIKNAFICNNFYKNFFIEKKEGRAGVFDEEQIVPNDGNVVFEEKDPLDKYFAF